MIYLYHVNTFAYHELKDQIAIGRMNGDLIFETDHQMSGLHAMINLELKDGATVVYVEDLNSKNLSIVNRIQISPYTKTRIKIFSLLEIGSQHFILSDSDSIPLETLNKILDYNMRKPIVKVDRDKTISRINNLPEGIDVPGKEKLLAEAEKELLVVEQTLHSEFARIEQARERLLMTSKNKKEDLTKRIAAIRIDLQNAQKLKAEYDNKKKLINLKAIG